MRYCIPSGKRKCHIDVKYDNDPGVINMLNSFDWQALCTVPDSLHEKVDRMLEKLPDHVTISKSNVRVRLLQKCRRMINGSKKEMRYAESIQKTTRRR